MRKTRGMKKRVLFVAIVLALIFIVLFFAFKFFIGDFKVFFGVEKEKKILFGPGEIVTNLYVKNPTASILGNVPISFGVPFAESLNLQNPNSEIMILDSQGNNIPAQWTVLSRWEHQTGNVKWVLVDFLSDFNPLEEKNFSVVMGSSNSIPSYQVSISDFGNMLRVFTGNLIVNISKESFNLFDSASLNENIMVQPGSSQGLSYYEDGKQLFTSLGNPENVSIEMAGPLHAVIRTEGWFKNASNQKEYLYYIARYHFWAGKNYTQVILTVTDRHDKPVTEGNWDSYWDNQTVYNLSIAFKGNAGSNSYWFGDSLYFGNRVALQQENAYGFSIEKDGQLQEGNIDVSGEWYPVISSYYTGTQGLYEISSSTDGWITFMPLLTAGDYEVLASWISPYGYLQAVNVSGLVSHNRTLENILIPQQIVLSNEWYSLGTFDFSGESNQFVQFFSNLSANKNAVKIDAVRFRQVNTGQNFTIIVFPKNETYRNPGIGGITGSSGIFFSVNNFWQNYPKAIAGDSLGNLEFVILPDGPYNFAPGMGKTQTFSVLFNSAGILPGLKEDLLNIQSFPLRGVADSLYYSQTKALDLIGYTPELTNPPEDLARWDELTSSGLGVLEKNRDSSNAYSWKDYGDYWIGSPYTSNGARYFNWANLQHNQVSGAFVQFLRTGNLSWWNYGERFF